MLHVQPPLSMSAALVQGIPRHLNEFPRLSPSTGFCWEADGRDRESKAGCCEHTPPLLVNLDHTGTQLHDKSQPASRDSREMHGINGINGNPLLDSTIGGHYYNQRVPVVASNAPSYVPSRPTADNARNATGQRPFYDTYHSAKRAPSPVQMKKDNSGHDEQASRKRSSSDGNTIASHLQIPITINDSKGSLPEFAAQVRGRLLSGGVCP